MADKSLKILFATIPQPKNRFVSDLQDGIGKYADVVHDYEAFWNCDQEFDIVHIHGVWMYPQFIAAKFCIKKVYAYSFRTDK